MNLYARLKNKTYYVNTWIGVFFCSLSQTVLIGCSWNLVTLLEGVVSHIYIYIHSLITSQTAPGTSELRPLNCTKFTKLVMSTLQVEQFL